VLAQASVVGFVPVSDMAAAERFYAGLLGLRVVERGPFAVVVASASGAQVVWFHDPDGNVLSLSQHEAVTPAAGAAKQ
jgi:catechol 2,3-dioxygenase-like lactoylglutathione lyase family enzyme